VEVADRVPLERLLASCLAVQLHEKANRHTDSKGVSPFKVLRRLAKL
jgi:hypothetical protein